MKTEPSDVLSEQLLRRICGEFSEMPGLRLTRPQARRLWNLDDETCARILDLLVDRGTGRLSQRRGAEAGVSRTLHVPQRFCRGQTVKE